MAERRECVICGADTALHFERHVLGKYRARYFHCTSCESLFVADPHWLPEAYQQALNVFDTGAVARNLSLARTLAVILYLHCGPRERFLDYAGGYGLLVRLMRDRGFDYFWEDAYADNLFARGFEADPGHPFAAISAFEVLEHLTDPVGDIARLASRSDTLVFSTVLWSGATPPTDDWWYYGFEHGQHVMFYSRRTLAFLAAKHDYRLVSDGAGFHVFTRRPDPHGVVEQLVTKQRVRRGDVRRCVHSDGGLRLPSALLTGPRVSMWWLDRAVRRAMGSRTGSDHDLLRARFAAASGDRDVAPGASTRRPT